MYTDVGNSSVKEEIGFVCVVSYNESCYKPCS